MGRTSFFRRRSRLVQPLAALPAPSPVGGPAVPDTAPSGSQVIDDMLSMLTHFLPPPPLGVPAPGVSIVSLAQTGIGLGNWRGNEVIGTFGAIALKGGRLDAVVRFELWGNGPGAVDSDMTGLQARLLAARDMLRASGFLLVNSVDTPITEPFPSISAWRKATTLHVLYEYQYQGSDRADSLIASIPVTIDGQYEEKMSLADNMVRWDNAAAPPLIVSGAPDRAIDTAAVSILAFLPAGWNGHAVTLETSVGGHQRQNTFATLREFFQSFTLQPDIIDLGGHQYTGGLFTFPTPPFPDPWSLVAANDTIRITYADNAFDQDAVVYLQILNHLT